MIIVSPGGPELGRQSRHDIATWEVANNPSVKDVEEATHRVIHHSDRRSRMSECLFWVPNITAEFGPDLDMLSRRTVVRSGMPAFEREDWPDEIEHLKRIQAVARAIRTNEHPEQGWYEQFKKDMKLHDPS